MLASAETVKVVADALRGFGVKKVVVDPVMVSTSGSHLLPSFAIATMRERLFPLTTLLTPNIPEALLILSDAGVAADSPRDLEEMKGLARKVRALGPEYVLLKGGHLPLREDGTVAEGEGERKRVVDILVGGRENVMVMVEGRFVESRHTHGTGCSLACKSTHLPVTPRLLTSASSCHRCESGERPGYARCRALGLPLRRGGDPDRAGAGTRQRAHQPLPLDVHSAVRAVSPLIARLPRACVYPHLQTSDILQQLLYRISPPSPRRAA
jgi:hypothetical protein